MENNSNLPKSAINITGKIKLAIDYTKTIKQVIAAGNYNWKNSAITAKNFPISSKMIGKKIEVFAKLFHFDCDISSADAIFKMKKAGYCPANLIELLALGAKYPELQRQFPIIALGSAWHDADGVCCVPYLFVLGSNRRLGLTWSSLDCYASYRFLGVRVVCITDLKIE